MRHILAFARIAFIDAVRRTGFWVGGLCFLALSALSAIPFAPGIPADAAHYAEAGVSTLLAGGLFLSLMITPLLLTDRGGRLSAEALLCLPTGPGAYVAGLFAGFGAALFLFFLAGGALLIGVTRLDAFDASPPNPLLGAGWSFFLSLLCTSLVLWLSRLLHYVPALAAALFVLILGQFSGFLPFPLFLFFPALGAMNPFELSGGTPGEAGLALVQIFAFTGLYLTLAVWVLRGRHKP